MTSPTDAPTWTHYPFDARGIARRFRHSAIFGALGALEPGEAIGMSAEEIAELKAEGVL